MLVISCEELSRSVRAQLAEQVVHVRCERALHKKIRSPLKKIHSKSDVLFRTNPVGPIFDFAAQE